MEHQLLQNLHHKLADLEHKVRAYRHGLAAEFHTYCQRALVDVDPSTAHAVKESLIASLTRYPTLGPELVGALARDDTTATSIIATQLATAAAAASSSSSSSSDEGRRPPPAADSLLASLAPGPPADPQRPSPPPLDAAFGQPVQPGSPHEREKEFQGLFTPFFLPLLDSSSEQLSSSPPTDHHRHPASPSLAEPAITTGTGIGSEPGLHVATSALEPQHGESQSLDPTGRAMDPSDDTEAAQPASPAASLSLARPTPTRSSTGDTTGSSAVSDRGETKAPRSALRRTSTGSSKPTQQSPRRVRFDVKGAEVLPTASPSDFANPRPLTPTRPDQPRTFDEIVGDGDDPSTYEPPPRKISSSEALRALSRTPLDDQTVWTVVNPNSDPDPEDSDDAESAELPSDHLPDQASPIPDDNPTALDTSAPVPVPVSAEDSTDRPMAAVANPLSPTQEDDESEDSSEGEFLSMGNSRSFENKLSIRTATRFQTRNTPPATPTTDTKASLKTEDDERDLVSSEEFDEDDDMFHFESGGLTAPPKPRRKPSPRKEQEPKATRSSLPLRAAREVTSQETSPAVPISKPSARSGSSTPPVSRFEARSLGSYRGRPVVMPVVKDPEVHAQAASLGEFNTFVGGLDGRSGVDEGDLNSFRASFVRSGFSGTPRSLTERMMMEDAQAERQNGD